MGKNQSPTVGQLFRALADLLDTTPGHTPERNKAIAHAEQILLQIEKDPQWQSVINGASTISDQESNARRYEYLKTCAQGEGYPEEVFECLTGGPGSLDEIVDKHIETSESESTHAPGN